MPFRLVRSELFLRFLFISLIVKRNQGRAPSRYKSKSPPRQISAFLLHYEEGTDGQGVYAGAVEAADGGTGVGDERLAEKVEAGIDENGGGSGFAKFVKQLPEKRIGLFFDSVNADSRAVEGEPFETRDGIFQIAQRGHKPAIGATIEKFVGAFSGNGKREGMKLLAMLDELIDVVEHVLVEG